MSDDPARYRTPVISPRALGEQIAQEAIALARERLRAVEPEMRGLVAENVMTYLLHHISERQRVRAAVRHEEDE